MRINWTRRWLRHARITDDPVGDLIADMKRDDDAPPLFASLADLKGYLTSKGACREALAAAPAAWRRYKGFLQRKPIAFHDPEIDSRGVTGAK